MPRILLIEDDEFLAAVLKESLGAKLYHVDHVSTGDQGLAWIEEQEYAMVILDWQLPGLSGLEVCRRFRERGGLTPILMLTAKEKLQDRVTGLDAGADDYLMKPFEMEELHARVRALLRRQPQEKAIIQKLIAGEIELDSNTGIVTVCGTKLKLTRREINILECLMKHPNELLPAETIITKVWPTDSEASPEVIRSHIARLRSKVKAISESEADRLKAVYGLGYRIQTD